MNFVIVLYFVSFLVCGIHKLKFTLEFQSQFEFGCFHRLSLSEIRKLINLINVKTKMQFPKRVIEAIFLQ